MVNLHEIPAVVKINCDIRNIVLQSSEGKNKAQII